LNSRRKLTNRITVIDTHVSVISRKCCTHDGKKYWGRDYYEFYPGTNEEEKANSPFASLTNEKSFWFTRPSLCNLLKNVGFTSIYECHNPRIPQTWYDRVTLVAVKGDRTQLLTSLLVNSFPEGDWSEEKPPVSHLRSLTAGSPLEQDTAGIKATLQSSQIIKPESCVRTGPPMRRLKLL
jgi:hypothetical protein